MDVTTGIWIVVMLASGAIGWLGGERYQRRGERRSGKVATPKPWPERLAIQKDTGEIEWPKSLYQAQADARRELADRLRRESVTRLESCVARTDIRPDQIYIMVEIETVKQAIDELHALAAMVGPSRNGAASLVALELDGILKQAKGTA